ncbi:MAG: hypothetical protein AAB284_02420, partial [Chloroflexota bacterium]
APLAGMRWSHRQWQRYVAVPLREGGFSFRASGVLCLDNATSSTAFYTFEIPANFPVGRYAINVYAMGGERWTSPDTGFVLLPFDVLVEDPRPPVEHVSHPGPRAGAHRA